MQLFKFIQYDTSLISQYKDDILEAFTEYLDFYRCPSLTLNSPSVVK